MLESKTLGDKNKEKQKTPLADLKYDGGNINLKSKELFFKKWNRIKRGKTERKGRQHGDQPGRTTLKQWELHAARRKECGKE